MENKTENSIIIESTINEYYGITKVKQTYKNDTENPLELEIILPLVKEIQFSKFTVLMNNQKIISKVLEKEKAEEKYSDAIAKGKTGVISSYNDENTTYSINIGNLNPKSKIELVTEFYQFLTFDDMSFCFTLMSNYPSLSINTDYNQIYFKINFETHSKITRLISKKLNDRIVQNSFKRNFNENYTKCYIEFQLNESELSSKYKEPINFLFRTEKMNEPYLIKEYNSDKDETSYLMGMIYNSKTITIPETPDINENEDYFMKYYSNEINETPSLFIFLIDQSGSMSGEPIKIVSESLLFFIQSLPVNSYFQLIGFGSSVEYLNNKPLEYTKNNIEETKIKIKDLKANLGGTDISSPLREIFNSNDYDNIKLGKNLFILTDGEVDNSEECLELISNNCEKFKVHSIGIGDSFDKNLIEKAGIQGKGSYHFVYEINQINSVIIQSLNKCLRPYLYDSKFSLKNEKNLHEFIPKDDICYQDEILNYSFIQKGKKEKENFEIEFTSKQTKKKTFKFKETNIINIPDGEILSKIIIGNKLKNKDLTKEEEIKLSKEYQILSKNTSLFAEISGNEQKIIGTLKNIKQSKYYEKENFNCYDDGMDLGDDDSYENECYREDCENCEEDCRMEYGSNEKEGFGCIEDCEKECMREYESDEKERCKEDCDLKYKKECMREYERDDLVPFGDVEVGECNDNEYDIDDCDKGEKIEKNNNVDKNNINDIKEITLTQDSYYGFWELNSKTQVIINEYKNIYDKIKKYVNSENCNDEKVIITFVMIYFLKNEKTINQSEYILIINKGIKYLRKNNFDYETVINNIIK